MNSLSSLAMTARRLFDSRTSGGCLGAGGTRDVVVTAAEGVVPSSVAAVSLNVTVTGATQDGWITVWPKGQPQPTTSNVNFSAGQTVPNAVIAKVGAGGAVRIDNARGCAHVIVDIVGWFAAGTPAAGGLTPLQPARIYDSRSAGGCIGSGGRSIDIAGKGGVPASGADSVAVNVTVTNTPGPGWLTVWPAGGTMPTASTLNFARGQTVANLAVAKLGAGGRISVAVAGGCADVVVDVVGWFKAGAPAAGGLKGLTPARILDTRQAGVGCFTGYLPRTVLGAGGVPGDGVAGVILNVTVTGPSAAGWVTLYPDEGYFPTASSVNFVADQTVANLVMVRPGSNGAIAVVINGACTHVIIDVVGYTTAVL